MTPAVRGLGMVSAPVPDPDPRVERLPRLERLVFGAAREALRGQPPPGSLGLVCATGYGGLSATEAFLQSVAVRGMGYASATAFHQSVHHSPAGQLSLVLGIRGPVLTVSDRELSGESALRVGVSLLNRVQQVLVVAGDEAPPVLEAGYRALGAAFHPAEGAAAILLDAGPGPLTLERCELFSHPTSARRFASPAALRPRLAASVVPPAPNRFVSIAAPTPQVERIERDALGPQIRILEDEPGATRVGFHPSAGLVRLVLAGQQLRRIRAPSSCVLHGLALGGGQSITVLRHDP